MAKYVFSGMVLKARTKKEEKGVSCDACMRGNFKGRRFKCLKCYDYDLCANCYEAGASTPRHSVDHPMQCILTRADFELYYGGESLGSDQPQAFTCPFCGRMGLTEAVLTEHVTNEHPDSTAEVVCPVCAAHPGGDPNLLTDDFSVHLQMQHRASPNVPRDLISFLDEPTVARHSARRIPQSSRGMGSTRVRRAINFSGGARDTSDPIAELLSQLSGVRRAQSSSVPGSSASSSQGGHSANNVSSQLQQLQMQLQLERQQVRAARQQLERLPRRQGHSSSTAAASLANNNVVGSGVPIQATGTSSNLLNIQVVESNSNQNQTTRNNASQFLIKYIDAPLTESEQQKLDVDRADRSFFMQELLLSMLTPNETISMPTQTKKDHVTSTTSAQPQVSQTITRPNVQDIERQPNNKSSTPPLSQQQSTNYVTDMPHRFSSPPSRNRQTVMQSQIPQPATNVRKQPKVTDNPPSH
ncbi:E3 ubiquitin-protein ligase KCMF1-like isoform X2 [Daktulosphaira vitifoliae]|uniref:E3 ubiquitin-protein ligase KCMF1-like isoform X2 n=1 Tax=Daktulosphaira vitifoliae TaxID=58002 RepID=UPI0021AA508B|nr:E3 ubiquitin-protein ligase KCMF1-like isoform X2 [Daktulosphaira vitifoliae]